jgi:hypothetical protein
VILRADLWTRSRFDLSQNVLFYFGFGRGVARL